MEGQYHNNVKCTYSVSKHITFLRSQLPEFPHPSHNAPFSWQKGWHYKEVGEYCIIHIQLHSKSSKDYFLFGFMVFNATFNNISVISWRSVLLLEETGENHWPAASHSHTLSQMLYISPWAGVKPTTSVVIGTDCIGSCKSNYHAITIFV